MIIICKASVYSIQKRFMMTSKNDGRSQKTTSNNQEEIMLDVETTVKSEVETIAKSVPSKHLIQDNSENENPERGSEQSMQEMYCWHDKVSPEKRKQLEKLAEDIEKSQQKDKNAFAMIIGNETISSAPKEQPFYEAPILTRITLWTDITFRTLVGNIQSIADHLGIQITQSCELA
jgi:hypothetical protein